MMPVADIGWLVLLCAIVFAAFGAWTAMHGSAIIRKLRWILFRRRRYVRCGTLADLARKIQSNNRQAGESHR